MSFKKAKTIAKAFTNKLPVGEAWYEKRLEICNSCEFNTKNIDKNLLSITDRIQINSGLCDNNNHCTACKCCIERKCSVKTETCGLVKIGKTPKWIALEQPSQIDETLSITNLTPEMGDISWENTGFIYDLGVTSEPKLVMKFRVSKKGGLNVISQNAGCSCTVGHVIEVDDETVEFIVELSTLNFRSGEENKRSITITYEDRASKTKTLQITFKCFKNGK